MSPLQVLRSSLVGVFLLSMFLLGSCIRKIDTQANAAFLPPQEIKSSIVTALSQGYFEQGNWPSSEWWEIFGAEDLNALIEEALAQNPSIQSIQQKIEMAKQMAIKSKSNLFPSLFFDGDETWSHISKNGVYRALNPTLPLNYNLVQLNFSFDYEFDFWGKYRNLFRAALGQEQVQIAESRQVELIVTTALAQAYFLLQTNLERTFLYEELFAVKKKSLELVNLLNQKAMLSRIDPASLTQDLEETQKELYRLESDVAANKHLINILRGASPDTPLQISDYLGPVPQKLSLPEDLSSDLLVRRPDLIASIWRVEVLSYETRSAQADFFPRINLKSFLGLESIGYKHLMNWLSGSMGLSPSIHIPIFKAGELRANLREKQAELEAAVYDYNDLLLKSLQEVSDILALTTSWYQQKQAQAVILENADLKLDLIQLRAEKGLDNLLEVLVEEEQVLRKELEDLQITYNQYISIINLMRSLGGGFANDAQEGAE